MSFTLPELPYGHDALEPHIDEETMRIHHNKHHASYVEKLNEAVKGQEQLGDMAIETLLWDMGQDIDIVDESLREKIKNNGGGHANHSLFWEIMSPNGGSEPEGDLASLIDDTFGSFESFKGKLSDAALGRFGSGWAWLVLNDQNLEITSTPNQDSPLMEGKKPILGVDVWEHAYYLKYQNKRADYIEAWWNTVNWKKVEEIFRLTSES